MLEVQIPWCFHTTQPIEY